MMLQSTPSNFEAAVHEHLDAAYNLARWLMHNEHDAQDVVQQSCLKAWRAFDSLRGGAFRPWFLTIIRNTSFTMLARRKESCDLTDLSAGMAADDESFDPANILLRTADVEMVRQAICRIAPRI